LSTSQITNHKSLISYISIDFKIQVVLVFQGMSPNLLSLNQFKTEFLLIGLPAQLPKMSDPSLLMSSNTITPTSSARNLGVIFDCTLSMSDHTYSDSRFCFLWYYTKFRNHIPPWLTPNEGHLTTPLHALSPHLSYTHNSITATRFFWTFPSLN